MWRLATCHTSGMLAPSASVSSTSRHDLEALRSLLTAIDDQPLPLLLSHATSLHASQDSITSSKDANLLSQARLLMARTDVLTEAAGLFSSNESAEDLPTSSLPYLLVPFYRAEFLGSAPATSPTQRAESVRLASHCYGRFMHRVEQYGLLGELGARLHHQQQAAAEYGSEQNGSASSAAAGSALANGSRSSGNGAAGALVASSSSNGRDGGGGGGLSAESKRQAKIEKFKRQKELRSALAKLDAQRASAAVKEEDVSDGVANGGPGGMDEEDERQMRLLQIELAVLSSLDAMVALAQETELLKHAVSTDSLSRGRTSSGNGVGVDSYEAEERARMMAQLKGMALDLAGGRKTQLQQQVFRPSHTLPTMTIEELADIECADAMAREEAQAKAEAKAAREKAERGSDDEDEVLKQRAKDDWKDANPRGAGNSKLKPCG